MNEKYKTIGENKIWINPPKEKPRYEFKVDAPKDSDLITALQNYVEFLENEIRKVSSLLSVRGYVCPEETVNEGNRLRAEIEMIRQKELKT